MTDWLVSARRLRAIAQTGLSYAQDPFDLERYQELESLSIEMLAHLSSHPPEAVKGLFVTPGYPTPKTDVRCGVFRDDQILLVRERSDGKWALPGGWADEQSSPAQSAEREVWEEAGLRVDVRKLVALRDGASYPPKRVDHIYKLIFLGEYSEPNHPDVPESVESEDSAAENIEISEVGFFYLDALPDLSLGRTLPRDIEQLNAHRLQPHLPTEFD